MLRHGIAFSTAGVMAVNNKTDRDTCCFRTHFRAIAVHAVEQMPFIIILNFGCHKRPAIAECVKRPDTTAVFSTDAVHPGKNMRLQRYPLRDGAEVLGPEMDTLFVRYWCDGKVKLRFISGYQLALGLCRHGYSPSIKNASGDGWRIGG